MRRMAFSKSGFPCSSMKLLRLGWAREGAGGARRTAARRGKKPANRVRALLYAIGGGPRYHRLRPPGCVAKGNGHKCSVIPSRRAFQHAPDISTTRSIVGANYNAEQVCARTHSV